MVRLALGFHPQLADEHKDELSLFARYLGEHLMLVKLVWIFLLNIFQIETSKYHV